MTLLTSGSVLNMDAACGKLYASAERHQALEIEPEQFLVLFRPGTTSVRSGL